MWITQLRIFSEIPYIVIATVIAWVVFTLSVWLPNIKLIGVVLSGTTPFMDKISLIFSLYGSIATNFSPLSATYTIIIALLFGINIALLVYYIRKVSGGIQSIKVSGFSGLGGLISGILGIGCAACGTFVLTSILTLFGTTGILVFLPFGGAEFGFLGVGLLLFSVYSLLKKIHGPMVCPIT